MNTIILCALITINISYTWWFGGTFFSSAPGDVSNDQVIETPTNENPTSLIPSASDRRSSRDIGVQAFSLEIEEEKKKTWASQTEQQLLSKATETNQKEFRKCKQTDTSDACGRARTCVCVSVRGFSLKHLTITSMNNV